MANRKCKWCGQMYDTGSGSSIWCEKNPHRGQGEKKWRASRKSGRVVIGVMMLAPNPWASGNAAHRGNGADGRDGPQATAMQGERGRQHVRG